MANQPAPRKKGGAWTRVAIFITLYVLLLESLIEWVLVLYLYGNKQVDSKMTPSLVLALIAVCMAISQRLEVFCDADMHNIVSLHGATSISP